MTMVHNPLLADPDRRYWRRRANRRVRKARLTRGLVRILVLGAFNLAILGTLIYAGVVIVRRVTAAQEFSLSRVEIEGAHRAPVDRLRTRLERFRGQNLLDIELEQVVAAVASDPWIASVSVKRLLPDTLRVAVTERTPCAIAVIGRTPQVVDETGWIIGPAAEIPDDLPVLTGLDALKGAARETGLRRGVSAIAELRRAAREWVDEISSVDVSQPDRLAVQTIEPGPLLLLDGGNVERNVRSYLALRATIDRRTAPIQYVDLRWQGHISVMPAIETTVGGR